MMPTQNDGMPSPTSGTARISWSAAPPRRLAASTASGTLISSERMRRRTEQPQRGRYPAGDQPADAAL